MRMYEFMGIDFENKKNHKENHYHQKVKEMMESQMNKKGIDSEADLLHRCLEEQIVKSNYHKELEDARQSLNKDYPTNSKNQKIIREVLFGKIEEIIGNPENYYSDLVCMIYMGLIHNEPLNSYVYRKEFKETDSADYKEINEFLKPLKKRTEKMNSTWIRDIPHVNKGSVFDNYPAIVKENENSIKSISGGCFAYHNVMMSPSNISIFDLDSGLKEYKRYGFGKSYSIYTDLNYTQGIPVENLLFMEYTLGIGFMNQIYYYIKNADSYDKLDDYESVVGAETEIQQFFFRKKLTDIIWWYVEAFDEDKMNTEGDYSYIGDVLKYVNEIVSEIFENVCEKWWFVFAYYREDDCKLILRLRFYLESEWNRYFDDNGVCNSIYNEWIDYVGIHDWRNISDVRDCFSRTSKHPYLLAKDNNYDKFIGQMFGNIVTIQFFDNVNNVNVNLMVEQPVNQIGIEIQQKVIKKMGRIPLPREEEEVYQLYYDFCNEEYNELIDNEKGKFADKSLKVGNGIDSQKAYAYMHKMILSYLLSQMKEINKY